MSEVTLMHNVAASVCSSLGFGKYIILFNYHINEWTNQMVLSINDKEEETNWVEKVDFLYSFWRLREKLIPEILQGHFKHEICNINSPHLLTESNNPLPIIAVSAKKNPRRDSLWSIYMYDIIIISYMALISFVISPAAVFFQITNPIAVIISLNWLNQDVLHIK